MPNLPSPARSQHVSSPRQRRTRRTRSVCSITSNTSQQLTDVIADSYRISLVPNQQSILNDNTDIEIPGRQSWWKRLSRNSKDVPEIMQKGENQDILKMKNVVEDLDIEILSQEKENLSVDLPESSDNESIQSIVIPQRKLFTNQQTNPKQKYDQIINSKEVTYMQKSYFEQEKNIDVRPKKLFNQVLNPKTKPVFTASLLNTSVNKTVNKTIEKPALETNMPTHNLFGNRPNKKRKNIYADFILTDSEDEIPDIQPKLFAFEMRNEHTKHQKLSLAHSSTSNITDIEMDDWQHLPSSTMVDIQMEEAVVTAPLKRTRLSLLSEPRESRESEITSNLKITNRTQETNSEHVQPAVVEKGNLQLNKSLNNSQGLNDSKFYNQKSKENTKESEKDVSVKNLLLQTSKVSKPSIVDKTLIKKTVEEIIDTDNNEQQNTLTEEVDNDNNDENFTLVYESDDEQIFENAELKKNSSNNSNNPLQQPLLTLGNQTTNMEIDLNLVQNMPKTGEVDQITLSREHNNFESRSKISNEPLSNKVNAQYTFSDEHEKNIEINKLKIVYADHSKDIIQREEQENHDKDSDINEIIQKINKHSHQDKPKSNQINECVENNIEISRTHENNKVHKSNDFVECSKQDVNKNYVEKNEIEQIDEQVKELDKEYHVIEQEMNNLLSTPAELESEVDGQSKDNEHEHYNNQNESKTVATHQEMEHGKETNYHEEKDVCSEEHKDSENRKNEDILNLECNLRQNESMESKIIEGHQNDINGQNDSRSAQNKSEQREQQSDIDEQHDSRSAQNKSEQSEQQSDINELNDSRSAQNKRDKSEQQSDVDEQNKSRSTQNKSKQSEQQSDIDEQSDSRAGQNESEQSEEQSDIDEQNDSNSAQNESEQSEQQSDIDEQNEQQSEIDQQNDSRSARNESEQSDIDEQNEQQSDIDQQNDSRSAQNESEHSEQQSDIDEHNYNSSAQNESEQDEDMEYDHHLERSKHDVEAIAYDKGSDDEVNSDNESNYEHSTKPNEKSLNHTHVPTGRSTEKAEPSAESPEAILHNKTDHEISFKAQGRNTSMSKSKTMIKHLSIRPSLAPVRESIGFSDGTIDSGAEGSGWDSHRTTRITLRQTFGKDFTPRKSLRTLVMERSAKRNTNFNEDQSRRQTNLNEVDADATEESEANSTDRSFESYQEPEPLVLNETEEESDHEASRLMRQATLETYLQKVKEKNAETRQKMQRKAMDSLKMCKRGNFNAFKMPEIPKPVRSVKKAINNPSKSNTKLKSSLITEDMLPTEFLQDMKYKPPKRFQGKNAPWITKRLYKYLEEKLEPKYDYWARVRAEKLVEKLYQFAKDVRKHDTAPSPAVSALQLEMARLGIVRTYYDFYRFFHDFMPREIRIRVNPDIVNKIPMPKNVFGDIIPEDQNEIDHT